MDKQLYKELCTKEDSISVFLQPWWLDTVCGSNNWDVATSIESNSLIAILPYYTVKQKGLVLSIMPPFTQFLGVWIKHKQNQSYTKRLSYEKKIFNMLIEKLPKFDRFEQSFHPGFQNFLPFYWKGFSSRVYCSYIIEDIENTEDVYKSFSSNIKSDIKKAQKNIVVEESTDIASFLQFYEQNNKRSNNTSKTRDIIEQLLQKGFERHVTKLLIAKLDNDIVVAASIFIEDVDMTHYLIGISDVDHRNSGASSLLIWEAIQAYSGSKKMFNFEGSMVESIEKYFRAFGAKQFHLQRISKTSSILLKIKALFK